jgi:hypothetical protein
MAMSQPRWWTISVTSFLWVDSKAIKTQNLWSRQQRRTFKP